MRGTAPAGTFTRPLVPLLAAYSTGIAAGMSFPGHPAWGFAGSLLFFLLLIFWLVKGKTSRLTPLLLFAALGYLSIQFWAAPRLPENHVVHWADKGVCEVVGKVISAPDQHAAGVRFVLNALRLKEETGGSFVPVTGKLKGSIYGAAAPLLREGDTVSLTGKLRSIHNFNNPGGFDYRRHMAFQRIRVSMASGEKRVAVLARAPETGWLQRYRRSLAEAIDRAGEGEAEAVLRALVIGDRQGITPQLRQAFNRAGVGHLLAISGLHIGMIAAVSYFVLVRLLSWNQTLLWHAMPRKIAALVTLIPVMGYGMIAGMSPSTQRAVLMAGAFLLALMLDRDREPFNILALAAMVILALYPPSLFTVSFQLSFAAVLFILLVLGRMRAFTAASFGNPMTRRLFLLVLVSAAAYAGTVPLTAFHFNQVSLVSLPANLLLVPIIGMGVVPPALGAACLTLFSPAMAQYGFAACLAILEPALFLIHGFADLPFAALGTVTPTLLEVAVLYTLMLALLEIRRRRIARYVLAVSLLILSLDAGFWLHQRFWRSDLRVTFIDVGQGSAALVEFPGGRCMMVDGGGFYDNRLFDVGERIVAPFLWWKKIKTIDIVTLSHSNSDHLNGLLYLVENFAVGEIWTNGELEDCWGGRRLMEIAAARGIRMPRFQDLPRETAINGVKVEVLYPPEDYHVRKETETWRDANNNSLVLRLALGRQSFLFPGDITRRAEMELVRMAGPRLESTVLLAPHHGSRTSSSPVFLKAVSPRVAVFSAGWQNRFNFPHSQVVGEYRRRKCLIYRTDRHGAVTVRTGGEGLEILPFTPDHGGVCIP